VPAPPPDKLTEIARATRVSVSEVRRYHQSGVLVVTDEETVTEHEVRRVRRVRRLRRDLGLDLDSIGIIVRLVERLEELESRSR
jgi:DNA-binding transcriptional MerR regulator